MPGARAGPDYDSSVSDSPVIEVNHLRKEFTVTKRDPGFRAAVRSLISPRRETVVAVDDVSFSVSAGEILGYLGPNGAGKSTTIKLLTGILVPTAGTARVNGIEPYRARTENAKQIGVVFGQRTQLWWDLPAVETFHILRDMYALDGATFERQIADLDEHLAITPFWSTPVRQLSLGQRMRCDLAAAMLHDPPVLFLDEPTVGMDVVVKEHVRQLLAHLAADRGTTIVLTTHDLGDVERLCERVTVLDRGNLLYDGDLERLAELHGVHRRLRVVFGRPVDDPHVEGAELVDVDGLEATFRFATTTNPGPLIAALSERFEIADLTIESVDFEEVIRLIYARSETA
jgi:ABC-2 type transport system ATP-binding protein